MPITRPQAREGRKAGFLAFNTDFTNTTGSIVNDYHVKLVSDQPINVSNTWQIGGQVQFNAPTITGGGTGTVQLDWSGATVNQGQTTHVGVSTTAYQPNLRIVESWWTIGGVKFDGTPLVNAGFNAAPGFTVAQVRLYDDILGTHLVSTQWIEAPGELASISSFNGTVYASWATRRSNSVIPLQDLNESLGGFGSFTPIAAVPEPPALALLLAGSLMIGWILRRQPMR